LLVEVGGMLKYIYELVCCIYFPWQFLVVKGIPIKRYAPPESPLSFEKDVKEALGLQ